MAYQWDPKDYAGFSAAQYEWAQELAAKLELHGDERLLDLGCGDGRISALLYQKLPAGSVVGVDLSGEMVRAARASYPAEDFPRLKFCQMDAARLGFTPVFDLIFSNAALHWVPDHRAVLAGSAGSLKPGGRLLFQMGGRGNARQVFSVLAEVIARRRWRTYFRDFPFPYWFYTPGEYREWLAAAGLVARRVELIPKDMRHVGKEGFAGWARTTWLPYTGRVPPEERESFIAEIVEAYATQHPPDADGVFHVEMVRLEVEAAMPKTGTPAPAGGPSAVRPTGRAGRASR